MFILRTQTDKREVQDGFSCVAFKVIFLVLMQCNSCLTQAPPMALVNHKMGSLPPAHVPLNSMGRRNGLFLLESTKGKNNTKTSL